MLKYYKMPPPKVLVTKNIGLNIEKLYFVLEYFQYQAFRYENSLPLQFKLPLW